MGMGMAVTCDIAIVIDQPSLRVEIAYIGSSSED